MKFGGFNDVISKKASRHEKKMNMAATIQDGG